MKKKASNIKWCLLNNIFTNSDMSVISQCSSDWYIDKWYFGIERTCIWRSSEHLKSFILTLKLVIEKVLMQFEWQEKMWFQECSFAFPVSVQNCFTSALSSILLHNCFCLKLWCGAVLLYHCTHSVTKPSWRQSLSKHAGKDAQEWRPTAFLQTITHTYSHTFG